MSDRFMRKPLRCPKCDSLWMEEKQVREMWQNPHKGGIPLYSGATKTWIYCGECHDLVWKEGVGVLADKSPIKEAKVAKPGEVIE